jgi:DNA replication ATP-dependent helicase Dna2
MDLIRAQELAQQLLELLQDESSEKLRLIQERQILEQIYKELTAGAAASFNGLFARMQYWHDAQGVPEALVQQLNSLRILCNKVAHDEVREIAAGASLSGALCIRALLAHLHPQLENPELELILKDAQAFARRQTAKKASFICTLLDWKLQEQGGQIRALELSVRNEEGEELRVILRDDLKIPNKAKYTQLYPGLWKYAVLNCLNLSEVAGKQGHYIDNPNTIIVLEPDFLVDASAIAECIDHDDMHPELFMLSRLLNEGSSEKMLLGQMVNSMFDALIHEPELEYNELFKRALNASPIPLLALGRESSLDIYNRIREQHLPRLQQFALEMAEVDLLLEPSYLCPKYGLQGRLDLLYRDKRKFSIVELKSGKAHAHDVWPAQTYQVVAYNMIIRNAYGAEALGSSSILYSAASDKSLRNVANISIQEQRLIHCRNRIVSIMHLLTMDPARFFDWLSRQGSEAYSPFMAERLERFKSLRLAIADFEYTWFLEQVKRISREIWQVKLGSNAISSEHFYGHNGLWQLSLEEKSGKIISGLRFCEHDTRTLKLALPPMQDVTDFRVGDIIILYDHSRPIDRQEIIRGVIESMDQELIGLRIRAGVKNNRSFGSEAKWAIEHDILETFLYAPFSSLCSFLEADKGKRDLLFGLKEPSFSEEPLMSDDLEAVLDRMQKAQDLHIVQGPPGTGKTSGLLSRYIDRFYHESSKRMIVLSFTNRAVDEICLCLKRMNIPFIRTGSSQVIEEALLDHLIKDKRFAEIEAIIKGNRIFVSTVQSANAYFQDLCAIVDIDEIIVDEASQILESNILGLLSKVDKCILIGDQNQLPAISTQSPLPFSFTDDKLRDLGYGSINQSLMERLFRTYEKGGWQLHIDMLKRHFRMHDEIATLVSRYYNHQLICNNERQRTALLPGPEDARLHHRLIWIETPLSEQDYYDPLQVDIIKHIVTNLSEAGLINDHKKDLGIVAPYRAMIHALKSDLEHITIDTVERFQGSERKIIILTLPLRKASSLKHLQAISDDAKVDRKLNVAISRAVERLIIIGNSALCRQTKHYQELYKQIRERGKIIEYQELGVNHG